MGTQNGHNVPFLESASLKKKKRKAMKRIKPIYKISERVIKKKSCRLVPKVVINLPFEVRKVEGSRKYRRRERVPKARSRREETITEPINSCIGEFQTIVVANDACHVEHGRAIGGGIQAANSSEQQPK